MPSSVSKKRLCTSYPYIDITVKTELKKYCLKTAVSEKLATVSVSFYYFQTLRKNVITNLVLEHMDMLMQNERKSPHSNSIIGKKSDEKAHKNS